ncbi:MAG TPA: double-strand break repair helicase AddA, partial [Aliiroseovarius sp.]|nr:double-strand break repair helicase AddA [Aliiroseovarius sp.]
KARGRRLHKLLEVLPAHPRAQWQDMGRALLEGAADHEAMLAEVTALLDNPDLSHVFAPDTLAEVDVSAQLALRGNARMHGSIDRLIIGADEVTVIDFKSNAVVPTCAENVPDGILRQMGAYIEAITQIFPKHSAKCAILWTTNAELMPIDPALARAALPAP